MYQNKIISVLIARIFHYFALNKIILLIRVAIINKPGLLNENK